ncbi:hypothetical protein DPX39_110098000 [Trypanosoma brucei equiperdum]|uniref:Uncharacterized protein n=1 Tax=Trypanosoma brucei equiperdum TaxID=630700 RepID=A0A3L6KSW1_9TRYP|nr:hypothetical protein DPX39_110098000 [Trypanosoma brucei equiperdum]
MDPRRGGTRSNVGASSACDKDFLQTIRNYSMRVQQEEWMYSGPSAYFSLPKNSAPSGTK